MHNLLRPPLYNRRSQGAARDWFSVANAESDTAEVYIYDVIGDFWGMGVPASEFVREVRAITAANILLRINSPGGIVDDAVAMRNALLAHPADLVTRIEGLAASSASWVGLGKGRVEMAPHSKLMIHEPMSFAGGRAADFRKEADVLDMYANDIAEMYREKAGGPVEDWLKLMTEETWYTAQGAVDAGLADAVVGGKASTEDRWDPAVLALFKHTPADLLKRRPGNGGMPSIRDAEQALRDAGFSRNDAKALVSRGWDALDEPQGTPGLGGLLAAIKAATPQGVTA